MRRLYPEQSKGTETNGTAEITAQKGFGRQAETGGEDNYDNARKEGSDVAQGTGEPTFSRLSIK